MLDPNNVEDLQSIEKCRDIVKEILNFGVKNEEILKIIDLLSLELEDTNIMRNIQNVLKRKEEVNKKEKVNIVL
jgi:hypothetical protein